MSTEARQGLRAAVTYNPAAAEQLLGMLRTLPISVRKKPQDRYGVLSLLLTPQSIRVIGPVSVPVQRPPLCTEDLHACEVFQHEWLVGCFSKHELAEALEQDLAALAPQQYARPFEPETLLIFRPGKTTLKGPQGEQDINLAQ
ncbi:MAG: hypothetical protein ACLQUY_19685 [Ktedonobacterales bacterium]